MKRFKTCTSLPIKAMTLALIVLGVSSRLTWAQTSTWILSPDSVAANKPFTLSTLSSKYTCNTDFSYQNVTIGDGSILLGVTGSASPAHKFCVQNPPPMGPTFKIPALKAGQYKVTLIDAPACVWSQPSCKIAVMPEMVGVLNVGVASATQDFSISPNQVAASHAFDLNLLSYNYNCGTTYSNLSYSGPENGRIVLSYVIKNNPAAICPAIYKPYGPSFKIASLPAGRYSVFASPKPECSISQTPCPFAAILAAAGDLTVTDSGITPPPSKWYASPDTVKANQKFSLHLLNKEYGNCQTSFSHTEATVSNGEIFASFLIEQHPERVCITDIRPFGPQFDLFGLKPGKYPIRVMERAACEFTQPQCVFDYFMAPPIVDTLNVIEGGVNAAVTLTPEKVAANAPFDLLLSSALFDCSVQLSNKQVAMVGGVIHLSFDLTLTKSLCVIPPITVTQETFKVPALPMGNYTVVIDPPPVCPESYVLCDTSYHQPGIGALTVTPPSAIIQHLSHSCSSAIQYLPGLQALQLHLELRQASRFTAQLFGISGRHQESFPPRLLSGGNQNLLLTVRRPLQPGLYFVQTQIEGEPPQRLRFEISHPR